MAAMNDFRRFGLLATVVGLTLASVTAAAVEPGEARRLSHVVIFTLKDQSEASREAFLASCEKYLTGHDGVLSYSAGVIAEDVVEPVSDREFDVALMIVFQSKAASDAYQVSSRHKAFVAENKAKFAKVRVFDSYLPKSDQ